MDQSLIRDEALSSTKKWMEAHAFMTEDASNMVSSIWNGLTKWDIMARMNTVPSTKQGWESGTEIHVQQRQLKTMVMNNTLIMLKNTIRHYKLNSSKPNKCNNYDTATQWETTEMELFCFCVECVLINSHMCTYIWVCVFPSVCT